METLWPVTELRRLAYNLYGWLAGLSRDLGLLTAYYGLRRLATEWRLTDTIQKIAAENLTVTSICHNSNPLTLTVARLGLQLPSTNGILIVK